MVLLERHVVETLLDASIGHCYGHTYSDPVLRLAFQRALAEPGRCPGTMIYGNTTLYGPDRAANYAALGSYLAVDVYGQRTRPSGHAVNPVPVTEAERIPEIDEIVDAHRYAARLIERSPGMDALTNASEADALAVRLRSGGERFRDRVMRGLAAAGIDTGDAFELLLALRRLGARTLETRFGPGEPGADRRRPLVPSATLVDLERRGRTLGERMDATVVARLAATGLVGCVATTDVHEYGKVLVESLLGAIGVETVDAGVSVDPDVLAARAAAAGADFIAISTYNGVALDFVRRLADALADTGAAPPVYIGGKLNQVPDASNTSLPVDVSAAIASAGAIPCHSVEDMIADLLRLAAVNGDGPV